MRCKICSLDNKACFSATVLHKYVINYYHCSNCNFVQTEEPYWLNDAYASPINNCDTGIISRNYSNIGLVLASLSVISKINGKVVDYAGGYGILVRLLRDRGVDAFWSDPYCQNLLSIGFEFANEEVDLVTAFEAFEHFVDPLLEVEKLFEIAPNLLISTTLIATPAPQPNKWWYYGVEHGQHIAFYGIRTLQLIAEKFGKHLVTDGLGCHFFSDKPVNANEWKLKVRLARHFPYLFSHKLKSKTWSDYEKMSRMK